MRGKEKEEIKQWCNGRNHTGTQSYQTPPEQEQNTPLASVVSFMRCTILTFRQAASHAISAAT